MLETRVTSSRFSIFHKNDSKFTQDKGHHFINTRNKQMFRGKRRNQRYPSYLCTGYPQKFNSDEGDLNSISKISYQQSHFMAEILLYQG